MKRVWRAKGTPRCPSYGVYWAICPHIHREATYLQGIPQGGYLPTGYTTGCIYQGYTSGCIYQVYTSGCITVGMPAMVGTTVGMPAMVGTTVGIRHPEVYQGGYPAPRGIPGWVSLTCVYNGGYLSPVCTTVGILHPERHHGGYPAPREAPWWVYLTRMINNGGYTSSG